MEISDGLSSGFAFVVVLCAACVVALMWHRLRTRFGVRSVMDWRNAIGAPAPKILTAFMLEAIGWIIWRGYYMIYRVGDRPEWMVDWAPAFTFWAAVPFVLGVGLLISIPAPRILRMNWPSWFAVAVGVAFGIGWLLAA